MGSDGKSKDKKKRRSSSIPPDSEEEGRSKRQRSGEDDAKGSSKKDKKRKSEHSKSRDKKHHSDKDKKSKEKRKSKRSKHDRPSKSGIVELSTDDYFAKNNEFATWLKEERKVFFSDLSSDSSRELFSKFVRDWNKGKLESKYYEGIASGPRTAHNWKIKG